MRRRVLIVTSAVLLVISAPAADAGGIPVFDAIADSQLVQTVKQGIDMVKQGAGILREAQQTVQFAQMIYGAVSHITDIGGIMSVLGMAGIQDPLPINVYSLEGILRGGGTQGLNGLAGNFSSLFNSNWSNNSLFTPSNKSLASTALNERLSAVSGSQGLADTIFANAQTRMPLLRELMGRLSTSNDTADKLDLIARLTGEQNIAAQETNQAIATSLMSEAAIKAADIRDQQRLLQSDQAWLDEARAQTGTW
jgi:hypothetical protein